RNEADSRRHGDIGDDVGSILQPQAILDQSQLPGVGDQRVENLLQPLRAQTLAKISHGGVVRQRTFQAQAKKQAVGNVESNGHHDFAVGEFVLAGENLQLEQDQRIQRRASLVSTVAGRERWSETFEVNGLQQPTQEVLRRHKLLEVCPLSD